MSKQLQRHFGHFMKEYVILSTSITKTGIHALTSQNHNSFFILAQFFQKCNSFFGIFSPFSADPTPVSTNVKTGANTVWSAPAYIYQQRVIPSFR